MLRPGQRLGPLTLGEPLGQGGSGAVFAAFDERLHREVAVKVLHAGASGGEEARRLLAEARALSQLDHPNIARVFDHVEGDPSYITLEKVEGQSLKARLARGLVPRGEGLRIAEQIADALVAAHTAGIIHRDLKPGNVMLDARGQVKVLDFGLARRAPMVEGVGPVEESALAEQPPGFPGQALSTLHSTVMGTPAFMSPEQAQGKRITTASDMYSLGLLLQELFTGVSPYGEHAESPQLVALAVAGETLPVQGVGGPLETLIERMKARAPEARPTAAHVLDRLRWIRGRPRRRRRWILAAGTVVLLIAAGTKYTLDLRHQRNAAVAARQEAEAVSGFLVDLFQAPDPYNSSAARQPEPVTATSILDRGVAQIGTDLEDQPAVRARLLSTMARAYWGLGALDRASTLYREALDLQREVLGADGPAVADTLDALARIHEDLLDFEEAERLHREALAMRTRILGENHLDVAQSLLGLGEVLSNRNLDAAAGPYLERSLAIRRRHLGDQDVSVLQAQHELAVHYRNQRDYDRAEARFRTMIQGLEATAEPNDPNLATAWLNLAVTVRDAGRYLEAEPLAREQLARMKEALGEEHRWIPVSQGILGSVLLWIGRYEEAEALYLDAVDRVDRQEADTPAAALRYLDLGLFYQISRRPDEAVPWLERALTIFTGSLEAGNVRLLSTLRSLMAVRMDQGRWEAATLLYDHLLEASEASTGARDTSLGSAYLLGGKLALAQGDPEGALEAVQASLERFQLRYKEGHWRLAEGETVAGAALCRLGRKAEGNRRARAAHNDLFQALGPDSRWTQDALRVITEDCG
jgi:serine/threonine-protein kinase